MKKVRIICIVCIHFRMFMSVCCLCRGEGREKWVHERKTEIFGGIFTSVCKLFILSEITVFHFYFSSSIPSEFFSRVWIVYVTAKKRSETLCTCQNMKMHAWTEDYQDRFFKCTVVVWWFADMQVTYTYFVRRRTYLLKISSSWIIQCDIHLCFFCGNFPSPFDTSLKN